MKKLTSILFAVLLVVLVFSGCEDKTSLTAPQLNPKSGNADLTRFVTIGNSLTAGYQSGALYQSSQKYCFGNLIAEQVGTKFEIPYISDPGIGGRMVVQSFDQANAQISITTQGSTGSPLNATYAAPYNNLGVPGALLYDVLNATSSTTCASYLAAKQANPFFDIILRNSALHLGAQFDQAKILHPTFVILWIGNNDILGYATAGGTVPFTPTVQFTGLYSMLADSIASLGAQVVVANIPDVTSIPYFTTAGPAIALAMSKLHASTFYYQKHGETVATGRASLLDLAGMKILVTLQGMSYAGDVTGKFYKDYAGGAVPPGVNTAHPFGFAQDNPFPDVFVLDESEIADAKAATAAYNSAISSVAQSKGFGIFDINSFFNSVAQKGFTENGITFTTAYIEGGLFGLDGIHPTGQGQAVLANEFIKVINSKFGGKIPLIDVSSIPNSILLAKKGFNAAHLIPVFMPGALDHLLY